MPSRTGWDGSLCQLSYRPRADSLELRLRCIVRVVKLLLILRVRGVGAMAPAFAVAEDIDFLPLTLITVPLITAPLCWGEFVAKLSTQ